MSILRRTLSAILSASMFLSAAGISVSADDFQSAGYPAYPEAEYQVTEYAADGYVIAEDHDKKAAYQSKYRPGDANHDGFINSDDAVTILRYAANYTVDIDMAAADVVTDGKITTDDAVAILRYLARYDVRFGQWADSIIITKNPISLEVGKTAAVPYKASPDGAYVGEIEWSTDDPSVVTVDSNGNITGISPGTAHVYAYPREDISGSVAKVVVSQAEKEPDSVSLNATDITLFAGDSFKLSAEVSPSNAVTELSWSSSSWEASVSDDGTVTAIWPGTADITVTTSNGKTATCTVTIPRNAVDIAEEEITLYKGESRKLSASVTNSNEDIIWSSFDERVATVSSDGTVYAVSEGMTSIFAQLPSGLAYDSCRVYVKEIKPDSVSLDITELSLDVGETYKLSATVSPDDVSTALTWLSSDPSVASVSSDGMITAISPGRVLITVLTSNGLSASCDVTVKEPSSVDITIDSATLHVGDTLQLNAVVSGSSEQAIFYSSDDSVAAVTTSGTVEARKPGTAVITASLPSGAYDTCIITVTEGEIQATDITIDALTQNLKVGDVYQVEYKLLPEGATKATLVWDIIDKSVATIDQNGVITAVGPGSTYYSVTIKENGASCLRKVTVSENSSVTRILLDMNYLTMTVGNTCTINAEVYPADAETNISWSTTDPSVVTALSWGVNACRIQAVGSGTAEIIARADNGITASCIVTVKKSEPVTVDINYDNVTLGVGESWKLSAYVSGSSESVTWSSDNTSVATVSSDGMVYAKNPGTAVITASLPSGAYDTCTFTVTEKEPDSVSLDTTDLSMTVGDTFYLTAVLYPSYSVTSLSWSSSAPSVASVSTSGKVTAKSAGTARITVTTSNGKTAYCTVTVNNKAPTSVSLNTTSRTMTVGETYTLSATISPSDAVTTLSWSSSAPSVASVSTSGKVTAKSAGTARITVTTSNGKTAYCTVTVKAAAVDITDDNVTLTVGESRKLTAVVSNSSESVTWSSGNTSVAAVYSDGTVYAKSQGTAVITARLASGAYDTCTVTVINSSYFETIFTGENLESYKALKAMLKEAAAGNLTTPNVPSITLTWNVKDYSSTYNPDSFASTDVQMSFYNNVVKPQLRIMVSCLEFDCPYELFWNGDRNGANSGMNPAKYYMYMPTGSGKVYIDGDKIVYTSKFGFYVDTLYATDDSMMNLDTAKIKSVNSFVDKAKAIVAANANKSDYEKLKAYKNAICDLVSYDHNAKTSSTQAPWQIVNVFDGDPNTNAVCEGYSKAFQYLCDLSSFDDAQCYIVTGRINVDHMWNVVTIGGRNYLVDITNCDEGSSGWYTDDGLFLKGVTGSVTSGYTSNYTNTKYTYDNYTTQIYGTGSDSILRLSSTDYVP